MVEQSPSELTGPRNLKQISNAQNVARRKIRQTTDALYKVYEMANEARDTHDEFIRSIQVILLYIFNVPRNEFQRAAPTNFQEIKKENAKSFSFLLNSLNFNIVVALKFILFSHNCWDSRKVLRLFLLLLFLDSHTEILLFLLY